PAGPRAGSFPPRDQRIRRPPGPAGPTGARSSLPPALARSHSGRAGRPPYTGRRMVRRHRRGRPAGRDRRGPQLPIHRSRTRIVIRYAPLVLFGLSVAAPLSAQVVASEPVLDTVQIELRDELYRLRDTLTLVEAATARIARDLKTSSDQVLRSRARSVSERCQAAAGTVGPARALVTERA